MNFGIKLLYAVTRFIARWLFRCLLLFITIAIPYLILAYIFGEAGRRYALGIWIILVLGSILNIERPEWNLWIRVPVGLFAACISLILAWSVPQDYILKSILLVILGIGFYREWLTSRGIDLMPLCSENDIFTLFKRG